MVVVAAVVATFVLIRLAPGDPFAASIESMTLSPSVAAELRSHYGFDRPIPEQLARYVSRVARGDLGYSTSQGRFVADAIGDALPNTLVLMSTALVVSFLIGIAIGVVQAARRGAVVDHLLSAVTLFFYSIPDFWLALVILLTFTYWVPVFPSGGMYDPLGYWGLGFWERVGQRLHYLILPAGTLSLLLTAVIARYQRSAMLDVVNEEYIRTARAKGLDARAVIGKHALRNALLPVITLLGLAFPMLLGGAVFVESVFAWPGMGTLTVMAINTRDYHLVTGTVIVGSAMVVTGSMIADVLYAVVDPRLRRS